MAVWKKDFVYVKALFYIFGALSQHKETAEVTVFVWCFVSRVFCTRQFIVHEMAI